MELDEKEMTGNQKFSGETLSKTTGEAKVRSQIQEQQLIIYICIFFFNSRFYILRGVLPP